VALQGARLWDGDGRLRFDAPEVVAAVGWYADLALVHGVMPLLGADPAVPWAGWGERQALVREGRAVMWTDYTGVDRGDVWPPGVDVGMAPLPLGGAGAAGVADFHYDGLFISAAAADPQGCWEWITLLSAQPELVSGLPARMSILESAEFAEQVGEEALGVYRALAVYEGTASPATYWAGEDLQRLNEALQEILAGADPATVLAEAQARAHD
jgi:ABC-type glycerol-3-phosphate transport system substrate-binding protein